MGKRYMTSFEFGENNNNKLCLVCCCCCCCCFFGFFFLFIFKLSSFRVHNKEFYHLYIYSFIFQDFKTVLRILLFCGITLGWNYRFRTFLAKCGDALPESLQEKWNDSSFQLVNRQEDDIGELERIQALFPNDNLKLFEKDPVSQVRAWPTFAGRHVTFFCSYAKLKKGLVWGWGRTRKGLANHFGEPLNGRKPLATKQDCV